MTGRNELCPCGSGKKYKRCCLGKEVGVAPTKQALSPRFRFEPGSYGDQGAFMPSIACLEQTRPKEWEYHFVIVRPGDLHTEEEAAVSAAAQDLHQAFTSRGQSGSDVVVAQSLRNAGYVSVEGFKVVEDERREQAKLRSSENAIG